MSVARLYSQGGYTQFEPWYHLKPRLAGDYLPVVFLHGAGGDELAAEPTRNPNVAAVLAFLAEHHSIMCPDFRDGISADGSHTWGNDGSTDTINGAIGYLQANGDLQASSGKVLLLGTSMGMVAASNYARRFSANVAGIVAVAGATDVDYHYANGYATNIDAAYGGDWATNGRATGHDPIDFAGSLTVPLRYYYATDDTTVPPTGTGSYEPFVAAYGGSSEVVSMGTGGHTDVPWANIDRQSLLAFIASVDWA